MEKSGKHRCKELNTLWLCGPQSRMALDSTRRKIRSAQSHGKHSIEFFRTAWDACVISSARQWIVSMNHSTLLDGLHTSWHLSLEQVTLSYTPTAYQGIHFLHFICGIMQKNCCTYMATCHVPTKADFPKSDFPVPPARYNNFSWYAVDLTLEQRVVIDEIDGKELPHCFIISGRQR